MKQINVKTTQYQHGDFIITIFQYEAGSNVWLHHKDYGIMNFMFGVVSKDDALLKMIDACIDDYEQDYINEVFD